MKKNNFDYVILGAGIYGLHAAKILSSRGLKIAIVEFDSTPFMRATFINQARVHNGYHYPRSFSTAIKSSQYFEKFNKEFGFAVNNKFEKIYAISSMFSLTNAKQYKDFCDTVNIPCEEINSNKYFKNGMVEAAFLTTEYAFDANMIRDYMYNPLSIDKNVTFFFNMKLDTVDKDDINYYLNFTESNIIISTPNVLNATYAATNQIINKFKFDEFSIKYEICEMILTDVSDNLKNAGLTVMDGPFFSIMPFGFDIHSLTSVTFTPHKTCYENFPQFDCQKGTSCTKDRLYNCNICPNKPQTAFNYMYTLAKEYLNDDIEIYYKDSIFAIKPILKASEFDDSRPTIIKKFSDGPTFISVLSGKINTCYDLDDII